MAENTSDVYISLEDKDMNQLLAQINATYPDNIYTPVWEIKQVASHPGQVYSILNGVVWDDTVEDSIPKFVAEYLKTTFDKGVYTVLPRDLTNSNVVDTRWGFTDEAIGKNTFNFRPWYFGRFIAITDETLGKTCTCEPEGETTTTTISTTSTTTTTSK